jgi:hypothetical protein
VSVGIREYEIDWTALSFQNTLFLDFKSELILKDRDGIPIDIQSMQGGVFNPEGTLFYQVNGYCTEGR